MAESLGLPAPQLPFLWNDRIQKSPLEGLLQLWVTDSSVLWEQEETLNRREELKDSEAWIWIASQRLLQAMRGVEKEKPSLELPFSSDSQCIQSMGPKWSSDVGFGNRTASSLTGVNFSQARDLKLWSLGAQLWVEREWNQGVSPQWQKADGKGCWSRETGLGLQHHWSGKRGRRDWLWVRRMKIFILYMSSLDRKSGKRSWWRYTFGRYLQRKIEEGIE